MAASTMSPAADVDRYLASFARFEERRARPPSGGASWLAPFRRRAIERFAELGFPTTHEERWRSTNVAPIARIPFEPLAGEPGRDGDAAGQPGPWTRDGGSASLVFIDGRFAPGCSRSTGLPAGAVAASLAEAMVTHPETVESMVTRPSTRLEAHAFAALNGAFFEDGAFINVPRGAALPGPVHLVFLASGRRDRSACHPRILIEIGEGAQATIVESYVGEGAEAYLTNVLTQIEIGPGASLEHIKVQRESVAAFHIAVCLARLGRDSSFASHSMAVGGAIARNEIDALMTAEGGTCTMNGLYLARGRQQIDNRTYIEHAAPHGTSRELYKGILDGSARGVFDGLISVRPGASGADARQVNRNLLLSEDALADTTPQLEILNDDVKCSHAATIGRLSEDALFYLRSRGIDRGAARAILTRAFADELIAGIRPRLVREDLERVVSGWLERPSSTADPVAERA
jgi:Fe-S cluster assembly protein SufD